MSGKDRGASGKAAGYVLLVALVVGGTLAVGAVIFELTGSVAHKAGSAGWQEVALPIGVDAIGFVIIFAIAIQLMSGYRLVSAKRGFRAVHVPLAWTLVAVLGLHTAGAVYHSLQPPVEQLVVVLDVIGSLAVLVLLPLLLAGRGLSRDKRPSVRRLHIWLALTVGVVALVHTAGAIVHSVRG